MNYRHFSSDDEKTWSLAKEYGFGHFLKSYGLTVGFCAGSLLFVVAVFLSQ